MHFGAPICPSPVSCDIEKIAIVVKIDDYIDCIFYNFYFSVRIKFEFYYIRLLERHYIYRFNGDGGQRNTINY